MCACACCADALQADLWSVGTILFEMLTKEPPFNGGNHIQLLSNIEKHDAVLPPWVEASVECRTFLQQLLRRNPLMRMSFQEFFASPFLQADDSAAEGVAELAGQDALQSSLVTRVCLAWLERLAATAWSLWCNGCVHAPCVARSQALGRHQWPVTVLAPVCERPVAHRARPTKVRSTYAWAVGV